MFLNTKYDKIFVPKNISLGFLKLKNIHNNTNSYIEDETNNITSISTSERKEKEDKDNKDNNFNEEKRI